MVIELLTLKLGGRSLRFCSFVYCLCLLFCVFVFCWLTVYEGAGCVIHAKLCSNAALASASGQVCAGPEDATAKARPVSCGRHDAVQGMYYDVLRCTTMYYDVLRCATMYMYYDVLRCTTMYYDVASKLNFMCNYARKLAMQLTIPVQITANQSEHPCVYYDAMYYDALRCTTMYYDVRRCITMHCDALGCTRVYYDVRRCIISDVLRCSIES